jgi:Fic family protein
MSYQFDFSPYIINQLQEIERIRERVELTILPRTTADRLRLQTRIRSTHFSTKIEGNRLTMEETKMVIEQGKHFPKMKKDVNETEQYYDAIQQMEQWVESGQAITEERIRKLHAILYSGRRTKPTSYRDGQNVIRDSSGYIVYMPPESGDVPELMGKLVAWVMENYNELPVPIVAAVAHYQFETIHPFFDGNGRTGRLFATWVLYKNGYDMGKLYVLEEFYAANLEAYYSALVTHSHHNYYFGRNEADITSWIAYYLEGMIAVLGQLEEILFRRDHS